MARLLLHIGAHETATSYIQRLFYLNRYFLAENGVIYPDIGPSRAHNILVAPWIHVPEISAASLGSVNFFQRLLGKSPTDTLFDRFVQKYAPQKGVVFISAELFSRAEPQRVNMRDLARRLSPFEDVQIVYTMRHQVDYIQSIWLQVAKNGKAPRFDQFLSHALERHLASGLWVNHTMVIDHVLSGFSPDQLVILDYEASRRHPKGIAGPFFDLMNSPLRFQDLKSLDRREANISPDALATWLAHSICWPSPIRPSLAKGLRSPLDGIRERRGKKRTTLYTREEYKRVSKAFEEDNSKASKFLHGSQSVDYVSQPTSPKTLLFREDLTASDWVSLAKSVLGNGSGSAA